MHACSQNSGRARIDRARAGRPRRGRRDYESVLRARLAKGLCVNRSISEFCSTAGGGPFRRLSAVLARAEADAGAPRHDALDSRGGPRRVNSASMQACLLYLGGRRWRLRAASTSPPRLCTTFYSFIRREFARHWRLRTWAPELQAPGYTYSVPFYLF